MLDAEVLIVSWRCHMTECLFSSQAILIVLRLPCGGPRIGLGRELSGRRAPCMLSLVPLRGRAVFLVANCGAMGFLGGFSHLASIRGRARGARVDDVLDNS